MFKNLALKLKNNNYDVIFFIQSRGIIEQLVNSDGFTFRYSASKKIRNRFNGKFGIIIRSAITIIQQITRILFYSLFNKVDYLLGTDIAITHVGLLLRKPAFVFTDDDYVFTKQYCHLAYPFAKNIIAPKVTDTYKWESKKIAYAGTQKSAYLHPEYFKPNENALKKYELDKIKYYIIRLVNYDALHDSIHEAKTGFDESTLDKIISILEKNGKVLMSIEGSISKKYDKYLLNIDPEDMHSILYYADLFIGDSQSMHIEAGLLGTPAVRSNKWVVSKDRVNVIDYLEKKYNLGISIPPGQDDDLLEIINTLSLEGMKEKWKKLSETFFKENTNLTDFLYWIILNYPQSVIKYKENNNIIDEFH